MFVVIRADGHTERIRTAATSASVRDAVGFWDVIELGQLAAFVSDTGHLEGLPYNVHAGALIGMLTGRAQLLAGPMAVTGWDSQATGRGGSEITDLYEGTADAIEHLVGRITSDIERDEESKAAEFARWAAGQSRPVMRVLTGEDALAHLLQRTEQPTDQ